MKVKLNDLKSGISGIYKINFPNGKYYIGLSNDIRRRMYEHNNIRRLDTHKQQPCDLAIRKYGRIEEIEILEIINDCNLLGQREKYWIKYYDSTNKEKGYNLTIGGESLIGEDHPECTFSNTDILDIRKRRFAGERKINVYQDYKDHPFGTFERIWLGRTAPSIGKQYLIPANEISRQVYSSIANRGENNNKAKLTEEDVKKIRERYDNRKSVASIAKDYTFINQNSVRRVCKRETWKHIK